MRLNYHLCQGNGFLGTDFLATKTRDARVLVHLGDMVSNGQSRYRALVHARGAACAQVGISVRSQERPIVEQRLKVPIPEIRFAT